MKIKFLLFVFVSLGVIGGCKQPVKQTDVSQPPQWAKNVVWYQIFVERFANGDTANDPTIASISTPTSSFPVPDDWTLTPWTSDWFAQEPWAVHSGRDLKETSQHRRYGGDLQGVMEKLDYLSDLGITAIYFNPLNDAPSLHKYDARNYHHIDINFGPDPEGDLKIMATENPTDPATWKWTSADRLFLDLVDSLHSRGIRVIVDYSWNHTGVLFWAWQDLVKNQEKSAYKDWYEIVNFDNPATPENEFEYKGWLNIMSLPELKKVDMPAPRVSGHPFEGNIAQGPKQHIFDVTRRWLAPDGDTSRGIDGFRLDVADQIPMGFWREYRTYVKSINPEAYLVGEIWWEKWPDQLMNPVPYCSGDVFDAVMFYQIYRPARSFFGQPDQAMDAKAFADSLHFQWNRLSEPYRYSQMNVNATHDAPRLLTCFAHKGKYKFHNAPYENPDHISGIPDDEVFARVRLYLAHQFTNVGAPSIWAGDEMGMTGGDDPDTRKPLWWPELSFDQETRTNIQPVEKQFEPVGFNQQHHDYVKKLIAIRKSNPVLITGEIEFLQTEGSVLVYKRFADDEQMVMAFNVALDEKMAIVPEGDWVNLLTDRPVKGGELILAPLEAFILKVKK
jgi:glycosidase